MTPTSSLQLIGQAVSALVAALGATGYIIALGAVVLWIRLHEAGFPPEVPLSIVPKQELLVLGAQALAVWAILALVLLGFVARFLSTPGIRTIDVVAALALGLLVSIGVLAATKADSWWAGAPIAGVLSVSVLGVLVSALQLRPPFAATGTALLSAGIGAGLPFVVHWLGGARVPIGTVLATWGAFIFVLILLPGLKAMRIELNATEAAAAQLETNRTAALAAGGAAAAAAARETSTPNRLLRTLRERARGLRTAFWFRSVGVAAFGLLLLGGVAVASQFDKQSLFRAALVSLNTGRCVRGTYLVRSSDRVVLGDQELYKALAPRSDHYTRKKRTHGRLGPPQNRVVVIPSDEVLELQVIDPTAVGVRLRPVSCRARKAVISPDGSDPERFRGPTGPKGDPGPTGRMGGLGAMGATGHAGPSGPRGRRGPKGSKGDPGKAGPTGTRGPRGYRGPTGPTGPRGRVAVEGNG